MGFGDKATALVWNTERPPAGLDRAFAAKAYKKLYYIDLAPSVEALRLPPSNRLEKLKGKLEGFWSVRIDRKYRIIFKFEGSNAYEVQISKHYQ